MPSEVLPDETEGYPNPECRPMRSLIALLVCFGFLSIPLFAGQMTSPVVNPPEIVYVKWGLGVNFSVRKTPFASAAVVAKVNCGDVVISFGEESDFYKVRTEEGITGYISSKFISKTKQDVRVSSSTSEGATPTPTVPSAPLPTPPASTKKMENTLGCRGPHCVMSIEVVETQTGERHYATTLPGTDATSQTNCNLDGDTINCKTTSQPSTPPVSLDNSIVQVYARVIWPSGLHSTLWCQPGFRKCFTLEPGMYTAEPEFDQGGHLKAVWISGTDPSGKKWKANYKPINQSW